MLPIRKPTNGSTLIEVLIAIVLVGLVVTGVMLSISYSVRNSAEARYREVASQLAQDGMEVVILRREVDPWSTFYGKAAGIYCIPPNSTTLSGPPVSESICDNNVVIYNKNYSRFVTISKASNVLTAEITVKWQSESNTTLDVKVTQKFQERAI